MGGGSKHNVPILDYFAGKSMHKLYSRGVPIMPVFIGAPHPDVYVSNWHSPRVSQSAEKPTRPRCEIHSEQSRPSTPSSSDPSDSSSSRKCCGTCPSKGIDADAARRKKTRPRGHGQQPSGPSGPTHPACFGWASSSSSSTKVAAPMAHPHHCYLVPGAPCVTSCSQDHIYDYHHPACRPAPACTHQPVENPRETGFPQAKCSCRPHQPVTPPEYDIRHHCYCGGDDCRSDSASFCTMDDAVSESSVEAVPGSEKGGSDSQEVPQSGAYHCYHPVYVAFPCGASPME